MIGRLVSFKGIKQISKYIKDSENWFPDKKRDANMEREKARINCMILEFK